MNDLINYEAVYRPAPATPGLLNMHCRSKEHLSKFNSKKKNMRSESALYKHLVNTHGRKDQNETFSDYFSIEILYKMR